MAGCEIKSENSFYDKWIEVNVWKTTEEMVHLFILDCITVRTINLFMMSGCTSWVVLEHETCLDDRQQLCISSLQRSWSVFIVFTNQMGDVGASGWWYRKVNYWTDRYCGTYVYHWSWWREMVFRNGHSVHGMCGGTSQWRYFNCVATLKGQL